MGEVKLFRLSGSATVIDLRTGNNATLRPGLVVLSEDAHTHAIATLEAENAKLRAELERLPVDGWKLVPVEPTPEMVSAAEEAHMPFGDMDIALRMAILSAPSAQAKAPDGFLVIPIQPTEGMRKRAQDYLAAEGMIVSDWLVHTAYTEMLAAAPSAPKADDPVKVQLLEALKEILYAEINSPISMNNAGCIKKMQGIARAAITAARKGEGE